MVISITWKLDLGRQAASCAAQTESVASTSQKVRFHHLHRACTCREEIIEGLFAPWCWQSPRIKIVGFWASTGLTFSLSCQPVLWYLTSYRQQQAATGKVCISLRSSLPHNMHIPNAPENYMLLDPGIDSVTIETHYNHQNLSTQSELRLESGPRYVTIQGGEAISALMGKMMMQNHVSIS